MTESEQLTEHLKQGGLPVGFYYYKLPNGDIEIGTDFKLVTLLMCKDGDRVKVLSEVPSFEVYKELIDGRKLLREHIKDTTNENTKLKTENKWYSEQLNEAVKEVAKLKEQKTSISGLMDSMSQTNKALANRLKKTAELLTMVRPVLQLAYNEFENQELINKIDQLLGDKTDDLI